MDTNVVEPFRAYPELIKCFNRVKNGRRVYPEQLTEMHTKLFGVEPRKSILKNFFKRLPKRGVAVVTVSDDGEYFKNKAINPDEAYRISVSQHTYDNRKWA